MIFAPTNRRIIRPYDKPSFEHTQRYGLVKGHWANVGRVGLWLLNEGSGGQVLDLNWNNYGMDFVNSPVWSPGNTGPAILFDDGSSQYLHRAGACGITGYPFTMVCWFNSNDQNPNQVLMCLGDTIAHKYHNLFARDPADSDIICHTYDAVGGGSAFASATKQWSANTWHMAAAVFAGAQDRRAYIDGGSKGTNVADNRTFGTIGSTTIGCRYFFSGIHIYDSFVSGKISLALLYNRIVTDSEIALLYREPFLGIQREPRITYFFVPTGGVVYQELNLTVTADASVAETDTHAMVDTGKAVQADAAVTESDTQQMVETGKAVEAAAAVSCTDLKVVFELNLEVTASGSVVATDAYTMIETGKSVTAIASPAVIDTQAMVEIDLGVSAEGSVSCTDTMGLLAHIAAFMILRQCTT